MVWWTLLFQIWEVFSHSIISSQFGQPNLICFPQLHRSPLYLKTYLEVLGRGDQICRRYKYHLVRTLSKLLVNKFQYNWLSFLTLQRSLLPNYLLKRHCVSASTYVFTHQSLENLLTQGFNQTQCFFFDNVSVDRNVAIARVLVPGKNSFI